MTDELRDIGFDPSDLTQQGNSAGVAADKMLEFMKNNLLMAERKVLECERAKIQYEKSLKSSQEAKELHKKRIEEEEKTRALIRELPAVLIRVIENDYEKKTAKLIELIKNCLALIERLYTISQRDLGVKERERAERFVTEVVTSLNNEFSRKGKDVNITMNNTTPATELNFNASSKISNINIQENKDGDT